MSVQSSSISLLHQFLNADEAYLVVDRNWSIVEMSANVPRFSDGSIQLYQDVRQSFPELIGIDSLMEDGEQRFELKGIRRSTFYFNLRIFRFEAQWMIVLSDATEAVHLEHSLSQHANELGLLFAQLKAAKTYIDQVISSLPDALIVTNARGVIKSINPATEQLLEYTETELLNQSIDIVLQTLRSSEQHSLLELETVCHTKTGRSIPVAFSYAKVKSSIDEFDGFVYSLRDIRDRKQAELAKRTFFAMMSHEIRTPMNAVLGLTDILLNTELSNYQRELLATIQNSGDSLLTIINDVLDYSKIESGHLELECQSFSVQNCVQSAIELLTHKASEKNLSLQLELPETLPFVLGDQVRLRQILVNLIGNAIKFTSKGTIFVSVGLHQCSEKRVELEFAVKDNGIGMTLEQCDRLFQAFQQADVSTSRRFGGTGLGLAISKQLCELMGGKIWVESQINQGSTFYFTIVVPVSSQRETVRSHPTIDSSFALNYPLKILVAEDNLVNQKVIRLTLQRLGYSIDLVNTGVEAIEALHHQNYDVILMDLQMPEMDGLEATEQIHRAWLQHPSIVAMTASATPEDRAQCLAVGMEDYLTKPIQIDQLMRVLSNVRSQNSTPLQQIALENVLDLAGGSTEFVSELIDCFIEDTPKLLTSMQDAVAQQDFKSLQRLAHTLQSSSATFGAKALQTLSTELETMMMRSQFSQAPDQIAKLEAEYQQVKLALQAEQFKLQVTA
ncbi:multi-sensor hybrid histidine kinase [Leptolyngbya sp. NIES-3755]|nr:multi-sensor hybrid histidine kinase [Leptolyngbya sp. NIES-3755]